MSRPYDVLEVCQCIARHCHDCGYELDNIRMQKLLYFIQLGFYEKDGKPCFKEDIEAWDLGPVVPKAYDYYKKYGAGHLPPDWEYYGEMPTKVDTASIHLVVDILSHYSTYQLVDVSKMHTPWKVTYVSYEKRVIPKEVLARFAKE